MSEICTAVLSPSNDPYHQCMSPGTVLDISCTPWTSPSSRTSLNALVEIACKEVTVEPDKEQEIAVGDANIFAHIGFQKPKIRSTFEDNVTEHKQNLPDRIHVGHERLPIILYWHLLVGLFLFC